MNAAKLLQMGLGDGGMGSIKKARYSRKREEKGQKIAQREKDSKGKPIYSYKCHIEVSLTIVCIHDAFRWCIAFTRMKMDKMGRADIQSINYRTAEWAYSVLMRLQLEG